VRLLQHGPLLLLLPGLLRLPRVLLLQHVLARQTTYSASHLARQAFQRTGYLLARRCLVFEGHRLAESAQ
jgi:hypothetical protein